MPCNFSSWRIPALAQAPEGNDTTSINEQLSRIFARSEFQEQQPEPWDFIVEWLKTWFKWLGGLYDGSPLFFWILFAISLIVLVFLLAHMAYTVYRVFSADRFFREQSSGKSLRRQLSLHYQTLAEEAKQKQDYTEAIRYLFLSLVYHYDENDQFAFRPALTNREYLAGFTDRAPLLQQLTGFVDVLDNHWYGMRPCSEATYQSYRQSFDQLMQRRG
jgi:hypothetical protein